MVGFYCLCMRAVFIVFIVIIHLYSPERQQKQVKKHQTHNNTKTQKNTVKAGELVNSVRH